MAVAPIAVRLTMTERRKRATGRGPARSSRERGSCLASRPLGSLSFMPLPLPVRPKVEVDLLRSCRLHGLVRPQNADHGLRILAQAQLGGGEQPVDDVVVPPDAVVHELCLAAGPEDEERRHLALVDPLRELDVDLA